MRNISCSHTKEQVRARTKLVTRRIGWNGLRVGEKLRVVEKAMGLQPGENMKPMAVVRVVEVNREPLNAILERPDDPRLEGFPEMTPEQFVRFYCSTFKCKPDDEVTRIRWEYVE